MGWCIDLVKQYLLYLFRWQLSTPILAGVLYFMKGFSVTASTIIANISAGALFWVTGLSLPHHLAPQWEIREEVKCADCGDIAKGFRLVRTRNYDRTRDKNPEFRCERCSQRKIQELKKRGVMVD